MSIATAEFAAISDGLMSEKEFLQKIKISRATLNKYKSKKLITYFKAGRRILYDAQSLEDFKNNCARCIKAKPREQRSK
ncbi:MAG TPA: hypothetical protein VJ464_11580 [Blastocatellia bacterium]|nr:hypothetical protein [Blastocatellia bacterium]